MNYLIKSQSFLNDILTFISFSSIFFGLICLYLTYKKFKISQKIIYSNFAICIFIIIFLNIGVFLLTQRAFLQFDFDIFLTLQLLTSFFYLFLFFGICSEKEIYNRKLGFLFLIIIIFWCLNINDIAYFNNKLIAFPFYLINIIFLITSIISLTKIKLSNLYYLFLALSIFLVSNFIGIFQLLDFEKFKYLFYSQILMSFFGTTSFLIFISLPYVSEAKDEPIKKIKASAGITKIIDILLELGNLNFIELDNFYDTIIKKLIDNFKLKKMFICKVKNNTLLIRANNEWKKFLLTNLYHLFHSSFLNNKSISLNINSHPLIIEIQKLLGLESLYLIPLKSSLDDVCEYEYEFFLTEMDSNSEEIIKEFTELRSLISLQISLYKSHIISIIKKDKDEITELFNSSSFTKMLNNEINFSDKKMKGFILAIIKTTRTFDLKEKIQYNTHIEKLREISKVIKPKLTSAESILGKIDEHTIGLVIKNIDVEVMLKENSFKYYFYALLNYITKESPYSLSIKYSVYPFDGINLEELLLNLKPFMSI